MRRVVVEGDGAGLNHTPSDDETIPLPKQRRGQERSSKESNLSNFTSSNGEPVCRRLSTIARVAGCRNLARAAPAMFAELQTTQGPALRTKASRSLQNVRGSLREGP